MNCKYLVLVVAVSMLLCGSTRVFATTTPVLGDAQSFAVLAGSTVTSTGTAGTNITGELGVWSDGGANAVTGFDNPVPNTVYGPGAVTGGPGIVNPPAAIHAGDGPGPGTALNAQTSLTAAITALNGLAATQDLTGEILGDGGTKPTLVPGVYSFPAASAQLNGQLTLNAGGLDGVYWVFQIGTTLTTASASSVVLSNPGPNNGSDVGVFWVVGSSATLGTSTQFEGNILAHVTITLDTTASIINGRALAEIGAVNLDNNVISNVCPAPNGGPGFSGGLGFDTITGKLVPTGPGPGPSVIPEPGTFLLVGCGLAALLARRSTRSSA